MRTLLIATLAAAACGTAWSAETDRSPAFEVLTVKPSPKDGFAASVPETEEGGPGTKYPTVIEYRHIRMAILIMRAYGVKYNQLSGPEWIFDERYDISANIPPGTTAAQFKLMLQGLLETRFKLQIHYATGETPVYSLAVAESGPKFREHVPVLTGGDHLLAVNWVPPPTIEVPVEIKDGKGRLKVDSQEIGWLQRVLSLQLNLPVIDETGLAGRYDFALHWTMAYPRVQPSNGPDTDLFEEVEKQLGLKLEKTKAPLEMLVIDNVDKIPVAH